MNLVGKRKERHMRWKRGIWHSFSSNALAYLRLCVLYRAGYAIYDRFLDVDMVQSTTMDARSG